MHEPGERELVADAATEPFTLQELKTALRVDHDDEDSFILARALAVRMDIERYCGIALTPQTWKVFFNEFPDDRELELPYPPHNALTHVKYRDEAGTWQVLDSSIYEFQKSAQYAKIILSPDLAWWPIVYYGMPKTVEVQFTTGYQSPASIPMPIKQAMLIQLSNIYENREDFVTGTIVQELPTTSRNLLSTYRVNRRFW